MNKEGFIEDITRKLCENVQLNPNEIHTIISALRESIHCFQEPYYEVIYHDKYDNTETRIMNPVASRIMDMNGYAIQEDRFDLNFRRAIRVDDDVVDIRKSSCISLKEKAEHPQKSCHTCEYSDEMDGSHCYECIKGMINNYSPKESEEV